MNEAPRFTQACYLAIDPGANGGICWRTYRETKAIKMPPTNIEVIQAIQKLGQLDMPVMAYIELPPLFAGRNIPGSAVGKMMMNYGICYGACAALGFSVHPVRPPEWQKAHPVGTKSGMNNTEWKNKLKARACEIFPNIDVTLATADALLILDAACRGELK